MIPMYYCIVMKYAIWPLWSIIKACEEYTHHAISKENCETRIKVVSFSLVMVVFIKELQRSSISVASLWMCWMCLTWDEFSPIFSKCQEICYVFGWRVDEEQHKFERIRLFSPLFIYSCSVNHVDPTVPDSVSVHPYVAGMHLVAT